MIFWVFGVKKKECLAFYLLDLTPIFIHWCFKFWLKFIILVIKWHYWAGLKVPVHLVKFGISTENKTRKVNLKLQFLPQTSLILIS